MTKRNKIYLASFVSFIVFLICCYCLGSFSLGVLMIQQSESNINLLNTTGTLEITAFSGATDKYYDLEQIDVPINSIVKITPEIKGESVFVTDDTGRLTLEVPTGWYNIELFGNDSPLKVQKVYVGANVTNSVYLEVPKVGVYFYKFNCNEESPFVDSKIRTDFAQSIRRTNMISGSIVSSIATPAYSFYPIEFNLNLKLDKFSESEVKPNSELKDSLAFNLISDATPFTDTSIFESVIGQTKSLGYFKAYNIENLQFEKYIERLDNLDYEVAKVEWIYDSNNPLDMFSSVLTKEDSCLDEEYFKLIEEGYNYLNEHNTMGYEKSLEEIQSYLIEENIIIPFYFFDVLVDIYSTPTPQPENNLY